MGKGSELLALLKTGNSGEARRIINKLKKQGKKKILVVLNEQDGEGCTPLHYSAAYNFLDFIEDFLEFGAVVDVEDTKGYTPLHLAATNGRAEAVSVLLCRGADPDISAKSGDTPIHLASHNGHGDCVENLIREHAKCTMLNVSGQNPLDLACQNGHTEVVALLLRSGQFNPQRTETSQTSLKLAAKHGHTQVLSVLIKHGFDVNRVLPGAHGTCLHEAALYGKIEAVHYLLQCGANPSIRNTQGLTPLDIVNHYTDPRSAQQLKQLLKDALASQARSRMSQQHNNPTSSNQRYSFTQDSNPLAVQKQISVPSYNQPVTTSMAELIASKAASRRPMTTSPTRKDDDGLILRSATLSGMKRPKIDRSVPQQRRNSYSDDLGQEYQLGTHNRSNPPTLPRRTHPPTFKPVPPPTSPTPVVETPQPVIVPVQKQQTGLSLSEQIAYAAEMKLKKVKPIQPTPVPLESHESSSLENELLAKLKRRQDTISNEATTIKTVPSTDVKQVNEPIVTPSSPIKPAPKTKPKPTKPKEDDPVQRVLTWQEELATKRQSKSDNQLSDQPPLVKAKPPSPEKKTPPIVKSKPKPSSQVTLSNIIPPTIQPIIQEEPIKETCPQNIEQPRPQTVEQPRPKDINQPQPQTIEQPHFQTAEQPQPQTIEQPRPQDIGKPRPQTIEKLWTQTIEEPETQINTQLKPHNLSECSSCTKEDNPVINRDDLSYRPSTPSSDQMSRSTSISSIVSVPLPSTPGLHHQQFGFECVTISDWLTSYKLSDYTTILQNNGYDNTDYLLGVTLEELSIIGVSKPGHRKRILTALNQLVAKEHYLTFKPASVAEWLQLLGLSQYESLMIDNGYDDIDFITSVSTEELVDIGITKKGHLKRLQKGIEELSDMLNIEQPTPLPYINSYTGMGVDSPTHSISSTNDKRENVTVDNNLHPVDNDLHPVDKPHPSKSISSSQDSGIDSNNDKRQSGNFLKMKQMLEKQMGLEEQDQVPPVTVQLRNKGPPPIPIRAVSTTLSIVQNDYIDGPVTTTDTGNTGPITDVTGNTGHITDVTGNTGPITDVTGNTGHITNVVTPSADGNSMLYSTDDIDNVLDPSEHIIKHTPSSIIPELDDLDKALQGFDVLEEAIKEEKEIEKEIEDEMLRKFEEDATKDMEDEFKTDQMLADIDSMLADLNTHLDIMIPPT